MFNSADIPHRGKKTALAVAIGLLGAGLLGTTATAASLEEIKDRGVIRIAVANEIPYGFIDLNGEAKGAGPEVAQHLVKELVIDEIEWVTTNFGSLIPGLQADRVRSEDHTSALQSRFELVCRLHLEKNRRILPVK